MKWNPRALGKRAIAGGLLLALSALGSAAELSRYEERVDLAGDGSASVRVRLAFRGVAPPLVLLALPRPEVRELKATGPALASVRTLDKGDRRFLALELASGTVGPATAEISFSLAGYVQDGAQAAPYGNRRLGYRFVNVAFDRIDEFTATIVLPAGDVFNAVDEFSPEPEKSGTVIPFTISREEQRTVGRIEVKNVRLGDEVKLACTFRSGRKSKWLLFVLLALAAAYLVFFRDTLKEGKGSAPARP